MRLGWYARLALTSFLFTQSGCSLADLLKGDDDEEDEEDDDDDDEEGEDEGDSDTDADADSDADTDPGGPSGRDDDGDGLSEDEGDCDDTNRQVSPEMPEICDNGRDDNCDEDVDEDCPGETSDTGVAIVNFYVKATLSRGELSAAELGIEIRQILEPYIAPDYTGPQLCKAVSAITESGEAPNGCPDCEWSFLATAGETREAGAYCDQLESSGFDFSDTTYGVGFAYEYGGYEDVVFLYVEHSEWFMFGVNVPEAGYVSSGNANGAEMWRPFTSDGDR